MIGRALLTILGAIFFAIGWVAGKIHVAGRWMGDAIKLGWQVAHRKRVRKDVT